MPVPTVEAMRVAPGRILREKWELCGLHWIWTVGQKRGEPTLQFVRRATIGSIFEALRAGRYPASSATPASRATNDS
jgi:hypothetical protein